MMNYYDSAIYANTRQQDAQRAADEHRLAEETKQQENHVDPEAKTPIYAPLLARAGDALVEIGQQLQNRYGDCVDLPTLKEVAG